MPCTRHIQEPTLLLLHTLPCKQSALCWTGLRTLYIHRETSWMTASHPWQGSLVESLHKDNQHKVGLTLSLSTRSKKLVKPIWYAKSWSLAGLTVVYRSAIPGCACCQHKIRRSVTYIRTKERAGRTEAKPTALTIELLTVRPSR